MLTPCRWMPRNTAWLWRRQRTYQGKETAGKWGRGHLLCNSTIGDVASEDVPSIVPSQFLCKEEWPSRTSANIGRSSFPCGKLKTALKYLFPFPLEMLLYEMGRTKGKACCLQALVNTVPPKMLRKASSLHNRHEACHPFAHRGIFKAGPAGESSGSIIQAQLMKVVSRI